MYGGTGSSRLHEDWGLAAYSRHVREGVQLLYSGHMGRGGYRVHGGRVQRWVHGGRGQSGGPAVCSGYMMAGVQYMYMGQGCSYLQWVRGLGVQLTVGT